MTALIDDTIACLDQGCQLLQRISPDLYRQGCAQSYGSSLGGHLRHAVDHIQSFLDGLPSGQIDYDHRLRDPLIETDTEYALAILEAQSSRLADLDPTLVDNPVLVRMDGGEGQEWSRSTVRRELQFLISHTIHHYALIATIARCLGVEEFPPGFGVAPSTLKHRQCHA